MHIVKYSVRLHGFYPFSKMENKDFLIFSLKIKLFNLRTNIKQNIRLTYDHRKMKETAATNKIK